MPQPLVEVDSRRQVPLAKSTSVEPGERFLVQEHEWGIALVRCRVVPVYEAERPALASTLARSWEQQRNGDVTELNVDPETGDVTWR